MGLRNAGFVRAGFRRGNAPASGGDANAQVWLATADSDFPSGKSLAGITGIVKSTAGTPSAAVGGTDFVVPTGVAGGQTINGGTAAGENLILASTSNATKGKVYLGAALTVWIDGVAGNARFNIDTTGLTTTTPALILNGKASSGVEVQVTGTVPTGFVLNNSSGTRVGSIGLAVSTGDWVTTAIAGNTVITSSSGIFIKPSAGETRIHSPTSTSLATGAFLSVGDSNGALFGYSSTSLQIGSLGNVDLTCGNTNGGLNVARGTASGTSGTQYGYQLAATFGPASGTAVFRGVNLAYTVNQTGGANGTVTGIFLNTTETAVVGTHNLIDLQVGSSSKFLVTNAGQVVVAAGTVTAPSVAFSQTNLGWYQSNTDVLALSVAGVRRIRLFQNLVNLEASNKLAIDASTSLSDCPLQNNNDINTGISFPGGLDTLSVVTGGVEAVRFQSTQNVTIGSTSDSNNARLFVAKGSNTATSGTERGYYQDGTFAPTSGTAVFRAHEIIYTVNQTGGANGATTGLLVNATLTAAVGTHLFFDVQQAGTSLFKISATDLVGSSQLNYTLGSTTTTNNARLYVAKGTNAATSGTGRGILTDGTFAPASGTGVYRQVEIGYTVNQTGGANGAVTGLYMNATRTAVVGIHRAIFIQMDGNDFMDLRPAQSSTDASLDFNSQTEYSDFFSVNFNLAGVNKGKIRVSSGGSSFNFQAGASTVGAALIGGASATAVVSANGTGLAVIGTSGPNCSFFSASGSFGGGTLVIFIANRTTAPTSNPTAGGILYAESGALKWRGSSGTVTQLAAA